MFLSFLLPWSRLPDRGRSVSEVPRRGSQSPGFAPRAPSSITCTPSPSHKSLGSTPRSHITPRSLAIGPGWSRQSEPSIVTKGHANDTGLALVIARLRLAEQFCHGHDGPESSDNFVRISRRFPNEVAPLRDHSSHIEHPLPCTMTNPLEYTKTSLSRDQLSDGQDIPQHPDHRSILPSPGRPRVFRRNSIDACEAGVTLMILTSPDLTATALLRIGSSARALRLKSREDNGTSREGFPISRYGLENIERSLATTNTCFPLQKKSHSVTIGFRPDHEFLESGRCSPTRDGWNLKSQGDDLLPFCGVLESLNTSGPALGTLANCSHLIATIRDQ